MGSSWICSPLKKDEFKTWQDRIPSIASQCHLQIWSLCLFNIFPLIDCGSHDNTHCRPPTPENINDQRPQLLCSEILCGIWPLSFASQGQTYIAVWDHSQLLQLPPCPIFSHSCFLWWNCCTLNPVLVSASCRTRSSKLMNGNTRELVSKAYCTCA